MERWKRGGAERLQRCRIFDLDRVRFAPPDDRPEQAFWVIEAPAWINVIPLTSDRRVLLQSGAPQQDFGATAPGVGEALEIYVIVGDLRALQDRLTAPFVGRVSV